jgi:hypothetical protein
MISEVLPNPDETVASASEDIAPTYPYEDPTPGNVAAAGVAYTTLVDQHMVASEGMEDIMMDLLLWDGLLPLRHLGRSTDVALLLSSECLPSTASCPFSTLEETLDASLGQFFEMATSRVYLLNRRSKVSLALNFLR